MDEKRKQQEGKKKNTVKIPRNQDDSLSNTKFKTTLFASGAPNAAFLIGKFTENRYGNKYTFEDWLSAVTYSVKDIHNGDIKRIETILTSQALALDSIFTGYAQRSHDNAGHYPDTAERYMRLALKAQNQCRATLDTLAQIKNPKPTVITKQANISSGPQQVNNTINQSNNADQKTQKISKTSQNELLNTNEENNRLDTGTPSQTGRIDTAMETLDKVNRPTHQRRKSQSRTERQ
ncbi:MAG: hypothetical protein WCK32_04935 [Chlorobiaceae bacterium]